MTDQIFEIGAAGLETTDQRVRKLMDNIVNSEVPGYQKGDVVVRGFPLQLDASIQKRSSIKPQVEGSFYSDLHGALVKTDNKLDLALSDNGYFIVSGPWGEGYTRDGRFRLDSDGRLLSVAGNYMVMGQGGPIVVTPGADVEFTQQGEVKVDGVVVDKIRVVLPEQKEALEPMSGSIFKKTSPTSVMQDVDNPRLIQGYVESSNSNIVDEMMEMIILEREYSLNSKIISTRDANLTRALQMGGSQ